MSMIGNLLRVTNAELENYIRDSKLLEERVYPENYEPDPMSIDIDKSWEGLWFLLTGCGVDNMERALPPLSWSFFSGQLVDEDQDMGYGPAHYCTQAQVQQVSNALIAISLNDFRQKFDKADSTMRRDIYPGVLWSNGEKSFRYLEENFILMRDFYLLASQNGEAVITWIS